MDMPVADGENIRPLRQVLEQQLSRIVVRELKTGKFVDMPSEVFATLYDMAMSNPIYMVEEFHRVYGLCVNSSPIHKMPSDILYRQGMDFHNLCDLRLDLLREELNEYTTADIECNEIEMVDALCDIIYVAVGAALELGLPIRCGLQEVHRSNMSKLGPDGKPIYREDGKIMKGPDYTPPNWVEVFQEWEEQEGKV